jgi:hypothetical protein
LVNVGEKRDLRFHVESRVGERDKDGILGGSDFLEAVQNEGYTKNVLNTLLLSFALLTQGNGEPTVESLVERLRSEDLGSRNEAAEALKKLGSRALPALKTACKDSDAEVASRAKQILETLSASGGTEEMARIAKAYSAAGSLELKVSADSTTRGAARAAKVHTSGQIYLRGNQEVFIRGEILGEEEKAEFTFVSNGTSAVGIASSRDKSGNITQGRMDAFKPPAELNAQIYSVLATRGPVSMFPMLHAEIMVGLPFVLYHDSVRIRDVKSEEPSPSESVLTYRWVADELRGVPDAEFRLWYKPGTSVLIKRSGNLRDASGESGTVEEAFSDYVLGGKIPSERFALPNGSK